MIGSYLLHMIQQNLNILDLTNMADILENEYVDDDTESSTSNSNELQTANSSDDEEHKSFDYTFGWNIITLYKEILYETIHNVGASETSDVNKESLFSYIKEAFKINNETHAKCLEIVKRRSPPALILNVEVIAAKDVEAKDSTEQTDPFVTMYLTSSKTLRFNTSIKPQTLNPVWEEKFSMPLPENYAEHQLIIEMWDFDPYEPVAIKIRKLFNRKSVKVLRKLMSEIATRQNHKEFIGRAMISLNSIPTTGLTMWYNLYRKKKNKNLGSVKLKLSFSSQKDNHVLFIEYRRLLRLVLRHELETSQVALYWWSGTFSAEAKMILEQFTTQGGILTTDITLAEWIVYSSIHIDHPISFAFLDIILGKLVKSILAHNLKDDKIKEFWEWTNKFLPSCLNDWRKFKHNTTDGGPNMANLSKISGIIRKICSLEPMNDLDMMSLQIQTTENGNGNTLSNGLGEILAKPLQAAANDWFKEIFKYDEDELKTNIDKTKHLIELLDNLARDADLCEAEFLEIFQSNETQLAFAKITSDVYRSLLVEELKRIIPAICKNMSKLILPEENSLILTPDQNEEEGKILFTFYKRLKSFFNENYFYHDLFMEEGCQLWLDLSTLNAMKELTKAVELDDLSAIDSEKLFSLSSSDFLGIVNQIKVFWEQICWPNRACTCEISTKIGETINKCLNFYTHLLLQKIKDVDDIQKMCVIINDFENIYQNLEAELSKFKFVGVESEGVHSKCVESLQIEVKSFIDKQKSVKTEIMSKISQTALQTVKSMFVKGSEKFNSDRNSFDDLMAYLEITLNVINKCLEDGLFEGFLNDVWSVLNTSFETFIQKAIDIQETPQFFYQLRVIFNMFKENFSTPSTKVNFSAIDQLLKIQSCTTPDLIHEYYKNQYMEQKNMSERPYGELTVKCFLRGNILEIHILNGKNLKCLDKSCDSYVKVHFLPEDIFQDANKFKTQVQNKTEFPLYDDKFELTLTPAQQVSDGIIIFTVKDKNLFGLSTDTLGECYLCFTDLIDVSKSASTVSQQRLPLNHYRAEKFMTYSNIDVIDGQLSSSDFIRALELRHDDKRAKEFMRRITKM